MGLWLPFLYLLVLSLWTGGMAVFTFIVTPAIFRSYDRDQAGAIVGTLFPGYFTYLLALSGLAMLLFFLLGADQGTRAYRLSLFLLTAALLVNTYVSFKLHPEAVRVKQQVTSFAQNAPDSPARKRFRRIHAVSAFMNLFIMLIGAVLLALSGDLAR